MQEIVWRGDEVDLGKIPVLKCWVQDGGPFVTLPLVITNDPETGEFNMGMYRMQVFSKNTTGMHWQRHKTGTRHLEKAKKLNRMLEVAVVLGGDPGSAPGAHDRPRHADLHQLVLRATQGLPSLGQGGASRPLTHPPPRTPRERR